MKRIKVAPGKFVIVSQALAVPAEHPLIRLLRPLKDGTVPAGASGVIVHVHAGGAAHEVEVLAPDGQTIAVETVPHSDLQPQ